MHLAAIDIGTNSVKMIIVRVRADRSFEVIGREKAMVRLGARGLGGRKLTHRAMTAALDALATFARLAEVQRVDEVLAVATSATREAGNARAFLSAIRARTGIRTRVISGTEEARLIHLAATYGVRTDRPAVVIDIGGGSVEITHGPGHAPDLARSFPLGVIRLTEQYVSGDPLSRRDERRLERAILAEVDAFADRVVEAGMHEVIGTSGTILSLGAMAVALEQGDVPREIRNLRVSARSIRRLRRRLTAAPLAERLTMPGMDPRRADLSVAGVVLLDTLLTRLGTHQLTLCDLALREGLVLDYIRRDHGHIADVDREPDVRRRSVLELAARCRWEATHARQVARIAVRLFDLTQTVHGLSPAEREWLEYAGLLHDIGTHISYARHHRHSHYLIRYGDLRGFEPREVAVMALVALYHRRGRPRRGDAEFGALPRPLRRSVRVLAALLRLAESLDRSRQGAVRDLSWEPGDTAATLRITAVGDAELEAWAAARQIAPLERALGLRIRPVVASRDEAVTPPTRTQSKRAG